MSEFEKLVNFSRSIVKKLSYIKGTRKVIRNVYRKSIVRDFGPDLAAAQWIVNCGAWIKWEGLDDWQTDISMILIPRNNVFKVAEIGGETSAISSLGCYYLQNLEHLQKISFKNNYVLSNRALELLEFVEKPLKHLEICNCWRITDKGIKSLANLQNLEFLRLEDLNFVRNRQACLEYLNYHLPLCEVEWIENGRKKVNFT